MIKILKNILICVCWIVPGALPTWAQTEPLTLQTLGIQGERLRSERRRWPTSASSPGARYVVTAERLQEGQRTVADVLRQVPGVQLVQGGGELSNTQIRIRGSQPDQVLIIVDGVPLHQENDRPGSARGENRAGFDVTAIPLERLERLEVVRGAAAAQYGPGAAAGAILITTRSPKHEEFRTRATLGSAEFREIDAEWTRPGLDSALSLSANHRQTSGEYLFYDPDHHQAQVQTTPESEKCFPERSGGLRLRRCNRSEAQTLGLGWRRGARQHWQWQWQHLQRWGLGSLQNPRPQGHEVQERQIFSVRDGGALSEAQEFGFKLHLTRFQQQRKDHAQVSGSSTAHHRDDQIGAEGWLDFFPSVEQQIRLGGEAKHQFLNARDFNARRDQQAFYSTWTWTAPQSTLEAALRWDADSRLESQATHRLELAHSWWSGWGSKASFGTGYRPPTLYELVDPGRPDIFGPSAANPDLEPERSSSWDGGFFAEQSQGVYIEWLYFHQEVINQIALLPEARNGAEWRLQNFSRTRTLGWETLLTVEGPAGWNAEFTWTRLQAILLKNDRLDARDNGNQLPGVASDQGQARLLWEQNRWRWSLETRHSGKRYLDPANTRLLKPYQLWNLAAGWPWGEAWESRLEVKNVTNLTYSELENFPPPGRQWFLSLHWRWSAVPSPKQNSK